MCLDKYITYKRLKSSKNFFQHLIDNEKSSSTAKIIRDASSHDIKSLKFYLNQVLTSSIPIDQSKVTQKTINSKRLFTYLPS